MGDYASPPGRHRHACDACRTVWEHANNCRPTSTAHKCPVCGNTEVFRYEGPVRPDFADHHLHAPEVESDIPRAAAVAVVLGLVLLLTVVVQYVAPSFDPPRPVPHAK